MLRSEVRLAKGDLEGGRRFLEEATAKDSRLGGANPSSHPSMSSGEYDKAIERYRLALHPSPTTSWR